MVTMRTTSHTDPNLTRRKRVRFVIVALIILGVSTLASFANPTIKTNWITYPVTATSADQILRQLQENGPNGFWGFTRWYVRWTGACEVTLEIDYIMPLHMNRNEMHPTTRDAWDKMVVALTNHEQQHGAHGTNAAWELVQSGCQNGDAIVTKWSEQDGVYDRRTGHGRTEGVVFP